MFKEFLNANLFSVEFALVFTAKTFQQCNWSSQQLIIASSGRKCSWLHFCETWWMEPISPRWKLSFWSWPGNRLLHLVQLVSKELPRTTSICIRAKHLLACLLHHSHLFPNSSGRYARPSGTHKTGTKNFPHSCSSCECEIDCTQSLWPRILLRSQSKIIWTLRPAEMLTDLHTSSFKN